VTVTLCCRLSSTAAVARVGSHQHLTFAKAMGIGLRLPLGYRKRRLVPMTRDHCPYCGGTFRPPMLIPPAVVHFSPTVASAPSTLSCRGYPIPSPAVPGHNHERLKEDLDAFVAQHGFPVVRFSRRQAKEEISLGRPARNARAVPGSC
jgi:hypothetical protein